MGNTASFQDKLFSAVKRNDVAAFQALVDTLNEHAQLGSPGRAAILNYQDKKTRLTMLQVAASKNHHQILRQLIQLGADVHLMSPAGGALHEAACRRHEAAVYQLLGAGANPFAANAAGRTALDEAVLRGHIAIVRAIEKHAEFCGTVAVKTQTLGGLSHKYKARWAVLMPYLPFKGYPADAWGKPPRRMLWFYKDKSHAVPRCKLWVEGAVVASEGPGGTEATLRLHASHGEPGGDLAVKSSKGCYSVFLRPAFPTAAAESVYRRLVELLNGASPAAAAGQQPQATVDGRGCGGGNGMLIEDMAALPGESDEAFAARLASAISATSGHTPPPPQQQQPPPQQSSPQQQRQEPGPARPGSSNQLEQPGSGSGIAPTATAATATAATAAAPPAIPEAGSQSTNHHGNQFEWWIERQVEAPQVQQRNRPLDVGPLDELDLDMVVALAVALGDEPSTMAAPPLPAPPPAPLPPAPEVEQCVICLSAPREVGFLHGDSVHRCVCRDCSGNVEVGAPCPLCRQVVERVLGVF